MVTLKVTDNQYGRLF